VTKRGGVGGLSKGNSESMTNLEDLAPTMSRAIVINVGTKWISTLALLSALRYLDMPVTLIDCGSDDGSLDHFRALQGAREFDLCTLPLRPHGTTLDYIFDSLRADEIWLLDSDAEILSRGYVDIMKASLADPRVFGAGFVHAFQWLAHHQFGLYGERTSLYHERMWIPFTALKTADIAIARHAGRTFLDHEVFNDFWPSTSIARLLHNRLRNQTTANLKLKFLDPFRRSYNNVKPSHVYYDTGASVYEILRSRGKLFAGIDARLAGSHVTHQHGVTRAKLTGDLRNATVPATVEEHVFGRLREIYGLDVAADAKIST
jgi:hypothetical protein